MKSWKPGKDRKFLVVLLQVLLCVIGLSLQAQTPRKFARHDIVDVGNGQFAEIIQTRGEGPLEECDVIYYTTNRAQGTRTWENANRLREAERAAKLVKDIQQGKVNTLAKTWASAKNDDMDDNEVAGTTNANKNSDPLNKALKALDPVSVGTDSVKDVSFKKVIRRIDSVTKAKVDTFKLAMQRELEIQDSIANAGRVPQDAAPEPTHQQVDTSLHEEAVMPKLELEIPAQDRAITQTTNESNGAADTNNLSNSISQKAVIKEVPATPATQPKKVIQKQTLAAPEHVVVTSQTKPSDSLVKKDVATEVAIAPKKSEAPPKITVDDKKQVVVNDANKANVKLNNIYTRTAEINVEGVWKKATIIDKESEYLYKVHFEDNSHRDDEWVAVTQMRNIDSVKNTAVAVKQVKEGSAETNCSFTAPAPPVSDADKFSSKLAKRKIYENYLTDTKNKDASGKVGLTFFSFATETPFINTVSVSATQSLVFKFAAAPAGAMVYPVKTKYKICEQLPDGISSRTMSVDYACFRNKLGIWTCVEN